MPIWKKHILAKVDELWQPNINQADSGPSGLKLHEPFPSMAQQQ